MPKVLCIHSVCLHQHGNFNMFVTLTMPKSFVAPPIDIDVTK